MLLIRLGRAKMKCWVEKWMRKAVDRGLIHSFTFLLPRVGFAACLCHMSGLWWLCSGRRRRLSQPLGYIYLLYKSFILSSLFRLPLTHPSSLDLLLTPFRHVLFFISCALSVRKRSFSALFRGFRRKGCFHSVSPSTSLAVHHQFTD